MSLARIGPRCGGITFPLNCLGQTQLTKMLFTKYILRKPRELCLILRMAPRLKKIPQGQRPYQHVIGGNRTIVGRITIIPPNQWSYTQLTLDVFTVRQRCRNFGNEFFGFFLLSDIALILVFFQYAGKGKPFLFTFYLKL